MRPQPRRALLPVLLVLLAPVAGATHDPLDPLHAQQQALPDLISHTHDAEPVDASTPPRFCGMVTNIAPNSLIATPFSVELRVDGTGVNATLVTERMPYGHSVTLCWILGGPLQEGRHSFTVVADAEEDVPESNETNNAAVARWVAISPSPLPDLRVKSFFVHPRVARPGEAQSIILEVQNAGTAPSPATKFHMQDELGELLTWTLPPLAPREGRAFSIFTDPHSRPPGNFTASARLDPEDTVREFSEDNNEGFFVYEVPRRPMPDLAIKDAQTVGNLTARRGIRLDVTLANEGPVVAERPAVRLFLGETPLANATRASLAAQANATLTFFFVLPAGDHELRLVADPDAAMFEMDESNNVAFLNVTVQDAPASLDRPNLLFRGLDAAPDDPGPDEPVLLNALVMNAGTRPSNQTAVAFYADGKLLGRKTIPALKPESYYSVAWSWGTHSEGDHDLRVLLDPDDLVRESDERDNELASYVFLRSATAKPAPVVNETPSEPEPAPDAPLPTPPTQTDPGPARPTPPTTGRSEEPSVVIHELSVTTRSVPGGLKGTFVLALRNPTLDTVSRIAIEFFVDGQSVAETVLAGIAPAGSTSATSAEVDLPPGRHSVRAEVRLLDTGFRVSSEASYDKPAGEREGIPGPGVMLVALAVAGAAIAARRRR